MSHVRSRIDKVDIGFVAARRGRNLPIYSVGGRDELPGWRVRIGNDREGGSRHVLSFSCAVRNRPIFAKRNVGERTVMDRLLIGVMGWTAPDGIACARMRSLHISLEGDRRWNRLAELGWIRRNASSNFTG